MIDELKKLLESAKLPFTVNGTGVIKIEFTYEEHGYTIPGIIVVHTYSSMLKMIISGGKYKQFCTDTMDTMTEILLMLKGRKAECGGKQW